METCKTIIVSLVLCPKTIMEPHEKIMKASLDMFFRYGIKHVTMDDIARELGMSKKTIYQFYREKDDLVNQLCEKSLQEREQVFNAISLSAKDPIHEIMTISIKLREMLHKINPLFFLDMQKFYPMAYKRFGQFMEDRTYRNVYENIKRGKDLGVYRPDLDTEFVSQYRMVQIQLLIFGNYFNFDKISFNRAHELSLEIFIYGICTVKGHKLINNYKKIKEEE